MNERLRLYTLKNIHVDAILTARCHSSKVSSRRKFYSARLPFAFNNLYSRRKNLPSPADIMCHPWVGITWPSRCKSYMVKKIYNTLACFESLCSLKKKPLSFISFISLQFFLPTGLLYIHIAQNPTKPDTVAPMPEIQGQAPEMTKLRGHSSCAKWRTLTVFFSSMLVRKGRL